MLSKKIFIIFICVFIYQVTFGNGSPRSNYVVTKDQDVEPEDKQQNSYDLIEDEDICVPEAKSCTCMCTEHKNFYCKECVVLIEEEATDTCNPGEIIKFYCPLCPCDEKGAHVCEECYQKHYNLDDEDYNEVEDNEIFRKKREADAESYYDYQYDDPLPLSTEQIRELQRQTYLQRRREIVDKRREKQELAREKAELARQNKEMQKELEYQRQKDAEQRAYDEQQDYFNNYNYPDTDQQEDYFTKKSSSTKIKY